MNKTELLALADELRDTALRAIEHVGRLNDPSREHEAKQWVRRARDRLDPALRLASRQEVSVTVEELAKKIWLAGFHRAFGRDPTDPWENQSETAKAPHRDIARALLANYAITKRTTEG